jgi:hypothetical protein
VIYHPGIETPKPTQTQQEQTKPKLPFSLLFVNYNSGCELEEN